MAQTFFVVFVFPVSSNSIVDTKGSPVSSDSIPISIGLSFKARQGCFEAGSSCWITGFEL